MFSGQFILHFSCFHPSHINFFPQYILLKTTKHYVPLGAKFHDFFDQIWLYQTCVFLQYSLDLNLSLNWFDMKYINNTDVFPSTPKIYKCKVSLEFLAKSCSGPSLQHDSWWVIRVTAWLTNQLLFTANVRHVSRQDSSEPNESIHESSDISVESL